MPQTDTLPPEVLRRPSFVRQPEGDDDHDPFAPVLLRHRKRPEWGLAVQVGRHDRHRALQFEDGELRVFPPSSDDLFEHVSPPTAEAVALSRKLEAMSGTHHHTDEASDLTFEQQLVVFRTLYSGGFTGAKWARERRGRGAVTRLKRHRDAAIAAAQKELAPEVLADLIAHERDDDVVQRLAAVLRATDLVPRRQLEPLRHLDDKEARAVAQALQRLLHGEGRVDERMNDFVAALRAGTGRAPSWQLCTAPVALVIPDRHVFIRPANVIQQARALAPGLHLAKSADGRQYTEVLSMMLELIGRLCDAGYPPKDLMDVHDFMWLTLRPGARKHLAAAARPLAAEKPPESPPGPPPEQQPAAERP